MKALLAVFILLLLISLTSCKSEGEQFFNKAFDENGQFIKNTPVDNKKVNPADNIKPIGDIICDPLSVEIDTGAPKWDDNEVTTPDAGLIAELYYLLPSQPHYRSTHDYLTLGQRSAQTIFFSELFIPTRKFSIGFPLATGGFVKDDLGNKLEEYFALKVFTTIKLGPDDEPGDYEFALIADDGAVWKIPNMKQDELIPLVNNNSNHPSRMRCSEKPINMDKDTRLKTVLEYYQGPKQHISLIPMWRKISGPREIEELCTHRGGNSFFFNYKAYDEEKGEMPETAYKQYQNLLERGWKALDKSNYMLPKSAGNNPCL